MFKLLGLLVVGLFIFSVADTVVTGNSFWDLFSGKAVAKKAPAKVVIPSTSSSLKTKPQNPGSASGLQVLVDQALQFCNTKKGTPEACKDVAVPPVAKKSAPPKPKSKVLSGSAFLQKQAGGVQ